MAGAATVVFSTDTLAGEERFVRDHLVPALADLDEGEAGVRTRFFRYGLDPTLPGGEVRLTVEGEYESFVDRERPRWNRWRAEGAIATWTVEATEVDLADSASAHLGTAHGDVANELQFLAAEAGARLVERFDGRLTPVGGNLDPLVLDANRREAQRDACESPQLESWRRAPFSDGQVPDRVQHSEMHLGPHDGGESVPVGWWLFIHYVANVQGYSWDEEIDACLQAIRSRLRSFARREGTDYALRRTEELRQSVDDIEGQLIAEDRP